MHIKNAKLEERIFKMEKELSKAKKNAEVAKYQSKFLINRSQWESLRKEREFHKENYYKTLKEKKDIANDIKQLNKLHEDFVSKIDDLKKKYENLCKAKSLMAMIASKYDTQCKEKKNQTDDMMIEIKNVNFLLIMKTLNI